MFICTRSNKEDLEDAKVITYADSKSRCNYCISQAWRIKR